ncbi:hypothetical protein PSPO01_16257 [Paraphaeosphaeria sporulosa]
MSATPSIGFGFHLIQLSADATHLTAHHTWLFWGAQKVQQYPYNNSMGTSVRQQSNSPKALPVYARPINSTPLFKCFNSYDVSKKSVLLQKKEETEDEDLSFPQFCPSPQLFQARNHARRLENNLATRKYGSLCRRDTVIQHKPVCIRAGELYLHIGQRARHIFLDRAIVRRMRGGGAELVLGLCDNSDGYVELARGPQGQLSSSEVPVGHASAMTIVLGFAVTMDATGSMTKLSKPMPGM